MGGYNNMEDKKEKSKVGSIMKKKSRKYVALIVVVAILLIVLGIFYKGYSSAKEKYEATIKQLEEEVDRLSEPVAVYEEAAIIPHPNTPLPFILQQLFPPPSLLPSFSSSIDFSTSLHLSKSPIS